MKKQSIGKIILTIFIVIISLLIIAILAAGFLQANPDTVKEEHASCHFDMEQSDGWR